MSVIPFDRVQRQIDQARDYVHDPRRFLEEREKALPLLLNVLSQVEPELRRDILFVLSTFAKEEVSVPLARIMGNDDFSDELRDQAALYLSVLGPFLKDPQPVLSFLADYLKSEDVSLKVRAIVAMGWEGNIWAALPLIECLYDPDPEVQETAVTALCSLNDSRVAGLLIDRMGNCLPDQRRAIILNLWRFMDRNEEVLQVYLREITRQDSPYRGDVLTVLQNLDYMPGHDSLYLAMLEDPDPNYRLFALERLSLSKDPPLNRIKGLLDDQDIRVRWVAMKVTAAMSMGRS